jgi:hypothetical protein
MNRRNLAHGKNRKPVRRYTSVAPLRSQYGVPLVKGAGGRKDRHRAPFLPPEDWHEPEPTPGGYRIIVQSPGPGYRHVVTPEQIRRRLSQLPRHLVEPLQVVQLSRMTHKKHTFPCYGMQWGSTVYLYPAEESLVEHYGRPPKPAQRNEARMFGGRWEHDSVGGWRLVWTEEAIRDFYLDNILIHELGHLVDNRNTSYVDRERFAEWFAIEHGYKPSRRKKLARKAASRVAIRRHRSKL